MLSLKRVGKFIGLADSLDFNCGGWAEWSKRHFEIVEEAQLRWAKAAGSDFVIDEIVSINANIHRQGSRRFGEVGGVSVRIRCPRSVVRAVPDFDLTTRNYPSAY